jgi:PadR family transcriptional regulator, regulatory protein PadR
MLRQPISGVDTSGAPSGPRAAAGRAAPTKQANREILLAFWKAHVLHHAAEEGGVHGKWILEELRRHGYELSPGTLYPLLARMERLGWLRSRRSGPGARARKDYRLTPAGRGVLALVRDRVRELHRELVEDAARSRSARGRGRRRGRADGRTDREDS